MKNSPAKIQLPIVLVTSLCLFLSELFLLWIVNRIELNPLLLLGLFRTIDLIVIFWLMRFYSIELTEINLNLSTWRHGVKHGCKWSIAFATLVLTALSILWIIEINPLRMLKINLPGSTLSLLLFFLIGGIIAPIVEEIFFRGLVYGYFRRWGQILATIVSTGFFAFLHFSDSGLPVLQIIGGIVFAISYERSKHLFTPIIIHISANLSLFSLSLFL